MAKAWKDLDTKNTITASIKAKCCAGCDKNGGCSIVDDAVMCQPKEWVIIYEANGSMRGICRKRVLSA